jgi:Calcineurin-like phosphoesterase
MLRKPGRFMIFIRLIPEKMRILYFSDVHIEIRMEGSRTPWTDIYPLDLGPDLTGFAGQVELAVLAGDIGTIRPRDGVSVLGYAEQVGSFLDCPVVLVPGNHEYYRGNFDIDQAALLAAKAPGVTALDRGDAFFPHSVGSLRVLGATLWTDYRCMGDQEAGMFEAWRTMNDHRVIRRADGQVFEPADALRQHELSRAWLARRLGEPHEGPTLIVTHHVPHSAAAHPRYGLNPSSPAFLSNCDDLIEAAVRIKAVGWIFGHHHWSHRIDLGGLRLFSAQPGYPAEHTNWHGPGVLEI